MSNPFPSPGNRPLDQLKVTELRDELKKRGLSQKGVKKDLLERLDEAIRKEQAGFVGDKEGQGAYPSEPVPDQDSVDASPDNSGMPDVNDSEVTHDTSLSVNDTSPCVGVLDAAPVVVEPHRDVDMVLSAEERLDDVSKAGCGSMADVLESDKTVVDPINTVSTENTLVELAPLHINEDLENATEAGNQGSAIEITPEDAAISEISERSVSLPAIPVEDSICLSPRDEAGAPDIVTGGLVTGDLEQGIRNESLVLEPADATLSAPADDTLSAPAQDSAEAGVVGALEQEISVPEVTHASDMVIPPEGDKDVPSASVSDDILNAAGPGVLPAVETVVNTNDCPMQDVEIFESTVLTSVSVVTCVQESGKEPDDGALKNGISENAKIELVEEETIKSVSQDGMEAMDALGAASELLILEAGQELLMPGHEGISDSTVHLDLAPKEQQDVAMSDAHEDASAASTDLENNRPTAASYAPSLPIEVKSENIDDTGIDDAGSFREFPRGTMMEDLNFNVKAEPREAESRVTRRAAAVELVKMELQDIKEESFQKDRIFERSRPRDYEADRPRDRESDRLRHSSVRVFDERGRAENRSGRHFKEDGRKYIDETVYKSEDGMHLHTGQKRKEDDRDAKQQEPAKRMRRWNSGNQPAIEVAKPLTSGVVNEIVLPEVKREDVATPKGTSKLPGPARPAPPAAKLGVESNGEKRIVPPSTQPPSASLKIERFVRPFTLKAVKDLLAEFGECVDFWMDQIKTHCFVTFSSVEEAVAARNGLYDRQWPPSFGNLLIANFVDASEVKLRSDGTFEKTNAPALAAARAIPNHSPALSAQHILPNTFATTPPLRERQLMQPPIKDPEPPVPTLDDLFRKTKTKPHIYYLPLTDEQVAEKLTASKNEKLAVGRNNNQQPVRGRPVGRI